MAKPTVTSLDASTLAVTNVVDLGGVDVPMNLKFDASNKAWIAKQARSFAGGGPVDASMSAGNDALSAKVGGTDYAPTLILQNTRSDGSSGGTLYLDTGAATALADGL
ncbi:MAG: hypothetical protein AB8H79_18920 [Myxococcota bacterium]